MSSEPPPVLSSTGPCSCLAAASCVSPCLARSQFLLQRLARASDRSSLHSRHARPSGCWRTSASATARLKCCGQARPSTRVGSSSVPVIIAAPFAIVSPVAHSSLISWIRRLAEVVPDRRGPRHDVRLIAAVGDDVVRALRERQVLAAEVPADVHQLDGVERAAAAPRRAGGVRALALEAVLHRHEPGAVAVAPRHAEVVADVREERDVDVLEEARRG